MEENTLEVCEARQLLDDLELILFVSPAGQDVQGRGSRRRKQIKLLDQRHLERRKRGRFRDFVGVHHWVADVGEGLHNSETKQKGNERFRSLRVYWLQQKTKKTALVCLYQTNKRIHG